MTDNWLTVHIGDNRVVLDTLPDASVHCVVTSPPYWGLRDYGTATWEGGDEECSHEPPPRQPRNERPKGAFHGGTDAGDASREADRRRVCSCGAVRVDSQIGLEPTPEEYVASMVDVFRKVRRVLRDDGTVWLNLGDSYAGGGTMGRNDTGPEDIARQAARYGTGTGSGSVVGNQGTRPPAPGLKPKDLVGIPWRVAFALQADGWYLRSDIIWAKPNPMPESVTDRPTKSHEYLFLLTKSARYYFDQEAVREPSTSPEQEAHNQRYAKVYEAQIVNVEAGAGQPGNVGSKGIHSRPGPGGRNIRTVWTIATRPYPGAHFAVFPPALVEPCIKASTPERGVCVDCGAPWVRVLGRTKHPTRDVEAQRSEAALKTGRTDGAVPGPGGLVDSTTTIGWRPVCDHYQRTSEWVELPAPEHREDPDAYAERTAPERALRTELLDGWKSEKTAPAVALDPFGGSGTVGMVANKLSRRAVLIELNPEYGAQIDGRNRQAPLGL